MGYRRGQGDNRAKEVYRVAPSKLRTYVYCPRLYFFEVHMVRERTPAERLKMLVGRIYHYLAGLVDRLKGEIVEERYEARIGGYTIVGRPDSWRRAGETLVVKERKSGRGPRSGVWLSDLMQGVAYAILLSRIERFRDAVVEVKYLSGGGATVRVDSDLVSMALRSIEEMRLVDEGVVPYANRSPGKCSVCRYRDICSFMDELVKHHIDDGELYEPGSWVSERGSVFSGQKP